MKIIYISFENENWLDEYDFLRDVVGIIEEITYEDGIEVFVGDEIYREAMEMEEV